MNYGIKLSKPGLDIVMAKSKPSDTDKREIAHILSLLAIPYLNGASLQIERYKEAASKLQQNPVDGVMKCLHEMSCLFEDLATIAKYIELCDETHDQHQLFWDIRNLIRHDIRDSFDKIDSWKKDECAKRLGIPENLQASIGFDNDAMSIGNTNIVLVDLQQYIMWAKEIIENKIKEGQASGYLDSDLSVT